MTGKHKILKTSQKKRKVTPALTSSTSSYSLEITTINSVFLPETGYTCTSFKHISGLIVVVWFYNIGLFLFLFYDTSWIYFHSHTNSYASVS